MFTKKGMLTKVEGKLAGRLARECVIGGLDYWTGLTFEHKFDHKKLLYVQVLIQPSYFQRRSDTIDL